MKIEGSIGKHDIFLKDTEIYLTSEQAKEVLWYLQSFKEQEEFAPLPENEAFIFGELIDDVIVKNSIEIYHIK